MKKSFIIILIYLIILLLSASIGFPYNTKEKGPGGHVGLAEKSIELKKTKDTGLQKDLDKYGKNIIGAVSDEDSPITRTRNHFYNPITEKGLLYFDSAKDRAEKFYKSAVNSYCAKDKPKAWDEFGRALHLLHDMGSPSHVHNAPHAFQQFKSNWGFENYISNNWRNLGSQVIAQDCELGGGIGEYIDTMALYTYFGYEKYDQERITPYPISPDSILIPQIPPLPPLYYTPIPVTTGEDPYPNPPYNTIALLNQVTCYSAGLIDSFWNDVQKCSQKPPLPGPGGDHPDDNYEVSIPLTYNLDEAEYQWLNMRLAMKKDRIGYYWGSLHGKKYEEIYNLPSDASNELIAQKFVELKAIENLLSNYPYNETDDTNAAPDVAVLSEGFSEGIVKLLFKNKETARLIEPQFSPDELKNQPILIIPSGGLYGLENSDFFRASLDEYVKQGGTLIVFAQQRGYEFNALPVPQEQDGTFRNITGYGWTEDQSCFTNAAYIDTYHQILSGQTKSTPTLNMDGYFTDYPSSATVLLKRTANGQPAMLMYDYGQGKVIVTSLYSDFAYSHNQASSEEKALVRDMISWAKAPAQLPEVKPGQTVSVAVSVINNTTTNASSVKLLIYNPDRTTLLSEQTVSLLVPAGFSSQLVTRYSSLVTDVLGIYHIDYELYDATGIIIQPQSETDSGRFVVSNPPSTTGTPDKPIYFSMSTTSQEVLFGTPFYYTFHIWNNTDQTRNLKIKSVLPHTNRTREWNVVANPKSETTITDSALFLDSYWMYETMRAYLYDETGKEIASYMLSFKGFYPSAGATVQTDKTLYAKGETVVINTSLKNKISLSWQSNVKIIITDPQNTKVFEDTKTVSLSPYGNGNISTSFVLPTTLFIGTYTVRVEVWYGTMRISSPSTKFELPQSQISVTPNLPSVFATGNNIIPFVLNNTGRISVSLGVLDISLKDPYGAVVYIGSQPFLLAVGENKILDVPISIPPLKFGSYILTYTQSDETRQGKPTNIYVYNFIDITSHSLDKTSYRVRETANLTVTIANTGKFNLDNVSVAVSVPDANYTETQIVSLLSASSQQLTYAIPIPESITSPGSHPGTITLTFSSGNTLQRNFVIRLPNPLITFDIDRTSYVAGDTVNITFRNTGGVDASVTNDIILKDKYGNIIYYDSYGDTIFAGGKVYYSFQIPEQTAEGSYKLFLESTDSAIGALLGSTSKSLDISGLKAGLSVKTEKDIYLLTENIGSLGTITTEAIGIVDGNLHLKVEKPCFGASEPSFPVSIHVLNIVNGEWYEFGELHFGLQFSTQELNTSGYLPGDKGYTLNFYHKGAEYAFVDYIALRDSQGNIYKPSSVNITPPDAIDIIDITNEVTNTDSIAADVSGMPFIARWDNIPPGTTGLTLIMTASEGTLCVGTQWETDVTVNQSPSTTDTINTLIGTLGVTGKLYLEGTLSNSFLQTIASAEYPFYVIDGDFVFILSTDKKVYKPGEPVTITGEVKNLSAIQADGVNVELKDERNEITLYTANVNIPAGSSYQFTVATTANAEGSYDIKGTVIQNNSLLAESLEQYKVVKPQAFVDITAPDVVGNEPFEISIELGNYGETEAVINMQSSIDSQIITIKLLPNEIKLIQYQQQISQNTDFTFTFTGDLTETITKTVSYGLSASVSVGVSDGVYPEGRISIPVTITNTGQLDSQLEINFQLSQQSTVLSQQSKAYFIQKGASITDTLYFNLTEGDYQLSASSQLPSASAQANFSVRKENKVDMSVSIGTQTNELIPVTVNLTNIGYNEINGSVQLSVVSGQGTVVWNSSQGVPQLVTQNSQLLTFNINPSAIEPGNYTLKAELLDNSGQQITVSSEQLVIKGAVFQITQMPPYSTFTVGEEATFTFTIKNTGNQEGAVEFNFKAYDLIDSSQIEWLAPGEEKAISFSFLLPDDLEEKDYFADYELKDSRIQGVEGSRGQVKYRVAGINLSVNATLDKQYYSDGETAYLTLRITDTRLQTTDLNLFARVNYNGYENQQSFTLNGSQTLTFNIPLTQITGEKLFYGIYHESGRSIHLNSLYIYKAGEAITITTDKQVYNLGETVSVSVNSVSGTTNGTMTLTAPNYTETFDFTGSAIKSFTLPSTMTARTYFVTAELLTLNSELITASHSFDVAGISVKVKEATLDKSKYASSDTLKLSLTIESNLGLSATLKPWIVDPEGKYTSAGESSIVLSSSEPLLFTNNYSLSTAVSGIHRLVYGIYLGDLLLVSGSEAFDVGDAVLLGLSTDKTDYPTNTEPVTAIVSAYGTVDATLELQLNGSTITTESISFNSVITLNINIGTVNPGTHNLKAILTAGGLKSTKETSFAYGSNLPDLTAVVSSQGTVVSEDNTLTITTTVINEGKTPSTATTIALYEDNNLIKTEPVDGLGQGESQDIDFNWNVLGKAGAHIIKAVVDTDNTVIEFNENNNEAQLSITIPDVTINVETERETYYSGETVDINARVTNLTQSVISGLVLNTTVTDESDTTVFTSSYPLADINGEETVTLTTSWDTDSLDEGVYKITQTVNSSEGSVLASGSKETTLFIGRDFDIRADVDYQRVKVGETASYSLSLTPVGEFGEPVDFSVDGIPGGASAIFSPSSVVPPGDAILTISTLPMTPAGTYSITVTAQGAEKTHTINLTLDITDFTITITPLSQSVFQLDSVTYNVSLIPMNGFDSGVTTSIDLLPYGASGVLSPETVIPPANITLNIQTSKYLIPGDYTISVRATDGTITRTASARLSAVANPLIAGGIITGAGPGPQNKAWVKTFTGNLNMVSSFYAFDTKYGVNVASGDIDGDGIDEIIAGVGPQPNKKAFIHTFEREGTFITGFVAFEDSKYGANVASGDINGDWRDEIIVGTGPDPKNPARVRVFVFDGFEIIDTGLDFTPFSYNYGVNITAGDIDGDGIAEIITGAGPDPKNPARVKVFKIDTSGGIGNWSIVSTFLDFTISCEDEKHSHKKDCGYGVNVAAGDVDGDGVLEIITGAGPDPKNKSVVKIYKGDGTFTGVSFTAYPDVGEGHHGKDKEYKYGVYVSAGDIDGDGIVEIITGAGPDPQNKAWIRIFKADGTPVGDGFLAYPENMKYGVKVSGGGVGE